ncbi:hypothetical protein [Nonomuraea sp. NPDC049709]|uniref:hypothetical protein n=1 Tax=Nonomuraea sp. NPDC049709 TaxID=3154736 RepID=UPI0034255CE0
MALPVMTAEQRAKALEKAAEARTARRALLRQGAGLNERAVADKRLYATAANAARRADGVLPTDLVALLAVPED